MEVYHLTLTKMRMVTTSEHKFGSCCHSRPATARLLVTKHMLVIKQKIAFRPKHLLQ